MFRERERVKNPVFNLFFLFVCVLAFFGFFAFVHSAKAATSISTCIELQNMSNDLAGDYELTQDIDCSATSISNTQDPAYDNNLYHDGAGFIPVGNSNGAFTGSLSGNHHTINNITIFRPNEDYVGLFGLVNGSASLHDFLLLGTIEGSTGVGSLAGISSGSVIINNVYSSVEITADVDYTGGLVGVNYASITGSYFSGVINGNVISNTGGLAGANYGSIANSFTLGNILASANGVGGLTGSNYGQIINSYSLMHVNNSNNSSLYTGGLAGANYGSIYGSYFSGLVTGYVLVGGLVGYNAGADYVNDFYDKTASGDLNCAGNGNPSGCTAIENNPTYFINNNTNPPLDSWDFTEGTGIWETAVGSYPILRGLPNPYIPTVTTSSATSITQTGATLNGAITNIGIDDATDHGFYFGTTESYGETIHTVSSLGANSFTENTPTLICNTTYHFKAFAINSAGTGIATNGDNNGDFSFTTSACDVIVQHVLTYRASTGGHITGTTEQTVNDGASGTQVEAIADTGYTFTRWSDSSITNPRTDTNVTHDIDVTASFTANTPTPTPHPHHHTTGSSQSRLSQQQIAQIFGIPTPPSPQAPAGEALQTCSITHTLKLHSIYGDEVKCLQEKLKITSDGKFGPKTEKAVIDFQKANGLTPDGVVGPLTRSKIK